MEKSTTYFIISTLLVFQIFGLLPLSFVTWKKSEPVIVVSTSRTYIIYNIILIIIIIYSSFVNRLPVSFGSRYDGEEKLDSIMDIVSILMNTLSCIMLWSLFCMNHRSIEKVAHKFAEIDSLMRRIQHVEPLTIRLWQFIFVAVIYTASWIVLTWLEMEGVSPEEWIIYFFVDVVTGLIPPLSLLQYALIMQLIHHQFKSLNNAIEVFGMESTPLGNQVFIVQSIHESNLNMKRFQSIRCAHRMLYDLTTVISSLYSFPTLTTLGLSSYLIILTTFNLIRYYTLKSSPPGVLLTADDALWLLITIFPIIILITTLETLTNEYKRTAREILRSALRFRDCKRLLSEVKWFLREIGHNPMTFTAFGFFALDNTFFQSILSTTITYLIIVLQFQSAQLEGADSSATET